MKRTKRGTEILEPEEVKQLWARQYLIESRNQKGRYDIAGLALTLGISREEVRKQYASLLQALKDYR